MRVLERLAVIWLCIRIASAAVGTLVTVGAVALVVAAGVRLWHDLVRLVGW